MRVEVVSPISLINYTDPNAYSNEVELKVGTYQLEEINNPFANSNWRDGRDMWYVVKGTTNGQARKAWRSELSVILFED